MVAFAAVLAAVSAPLAARGAVSAGGGLQLGPPPKAGGAICMTGCLGLTETTVGGTVQISGANLSGVTKVSFPGRSKRVLAPADSASARTVTVTVPAGAADGKLRLRTPGGVAVTVPTPISVEPASALKSPSGRLRITDASATPRKSYYFGVRPPRLSFVLHGGGGSNNLRIDVVRSDDVIVRSMIRRHVPSNSTETVKWNGRDSDGKAARGGSYSFVVRSISGEVAKVARKRKARSSSGSPDPTEFKLYPYIFPVRGPHTYGDGIGAPRSGHTHQGQDVLADCGTKVVAARGGKVYYNAYDGAGGNYVVISPLKGTGGKSQVYMHLAKPSRLKVGKTVRTGQKVGIVGQTGDATACHLHFEIWSAPGWYTGGHFTDPAPPLHKWDRYS